jgi:hypothetical protein
MMDSTSLRFRRLFAIIALLAALPALAFNHDTIVNPLPLGRFNVACSNVEQDVSRIAPGASPSDTGKAGP